MAPMKSFRNEVQADLEEAGKLAAFEAAVLPHLAAAYNLARWLTRSRQDAEDLAQEAYLRAFKAFEGFRGENNRGWLLAIVRNTCYTRLNRERTQEMVDTFDEQIHTREDDSATPESLLIAQADAQSLRRALEELPSEFREAVILRELEGLSYKEIADVAGVPVGTVMSRLARARARLERRLREPKRKEAEIELPG